MNSIEFARSHVSRLCLQSPNGDLYIRFVLVYTPIYINKEIMECVHMDTQQPAPGAALKEWLELSNLSASAFSRLVPCSVSLPGQWARGDARPSYEMACRVEQLTDGMVPRTLWYPPGQQPKPIDIEDII